MAYLHRFVLALLLSLFTAVPAFAVIYVDNTTTSCSSPSDTDYDPATETCGSGSDTVHASLLTALAANPTGGRIEIRAGTYPSAGSSYAEYGVTASSDYGGGASSWDTAAVITNYTGETVTVNTNGFNMDTAFTATNSYIIWEGETRARFVFSGRSVENSYAFRVNNQAHHIRFKKLTIQNFMNTGAITGGTSTGSGSTQCTNKPSNIEIIDNLLDTNGNSLSSQEHAIYPACSQDWLVERNHIVDPYVYAIHFNNSGSGVTLAHVRPVIRYNKCEGRAAVSATSGCVYINRSDDAVIYRNLFDGLGTGSNKHTHCIQLGSNSVDTLILNNTCHDFSTAGVQISGTGATVTGLVVQNNIFDDVADTFQIVSGAPSGTFNANLCPADDTTFGAGACDQVTATPGFVSAGTDFSLAAGSAAIDNGVAHTGYGYNGTKPDIGAFETWGPTSSVVENATPGKLSITFENNVFPPITPASPTVGANAITSRKAGAANTVTLGTRVGTNQLDLTLTDNIANGNAVDWSYIQSSGNLKDSALLGGSDSQELLAQTNVSTTNNVGSGAATPVLTQTNAQYRELRGTETSRSVFTSHSTRGKDVAQGGAIWVRFLVRNTVAANPAVALIPRYSKNGGAYAVVPNDFDADNFAFCNSVVGPSVPTQGTTTTEQMGGSGTFVAGGMVVTSNAIPSITLASGEDTELDFCFRNDTDTPAEDTFDIRLYKQDGNPIDTYTVTPRLTVVPAGNGF